MFRGLTGVVWRWGVWLPGVSAWGVQGARQGLSGGCQTECVLGPQPGVSGLARLGLSGGACLVLCH